MIEQVISLAIGVWLGGVVAFIAMATTGAWLPGGKIAKLTITLDGGEPPPWFIFLSALLWPITILRIRKKQ